MHRLFWGACLHPIQTFTSTFINLSDVSLLCIQSFQLFATEVDIFSLAWKMKPWYVSNYLMVMNILISGNSQINQLYPLTAEVLSCLSRHNGVPEFVLNWTTDKYNMFEFTSPKSFTSHYPLVAFVQ